MYNSPYPMPGMNPGMVNNMPVKTQVNPNVPLMPQQQAPLAPPMQVASGSLGLNFGNIMSGNAALPVIQGEIVTDLPEKKKRGRSKKADSTSSEPEVINHSEEVNQVIYADTYQDTNVLLRQTIGQLDVVAGEMKEEMDKILTSRSMKGRHMALGNVSKSLSDMLSTKVQAIKELNNSIKAVNDMEYRRAKDNRNFESAQGDDKAIMDLYNAFIQAPVSANVPSTGAYSLIGPNMNDVMFGANMAGAQGEIVTQNGTIVLQNDMASSDQMQANYLSNLTPEQNAMLHEGTTETVVVYDKATGAKSFQVVDSTTMQPVPNMPLPDPMFLNDVSVDVRRKVARNTNLGQVYKVITVNDNVVSEY